MPQPKTLLVYGDEIESVLTAVSAARYLHYTGLPVQVQLLRPPRYPQTCSGLDWLGGLSTRGGLSYMDITLGMMGPLFSEFLEQARVIRVALNPALADKALRTMLKDASVTVLDCPRQETFSLPQLVQDGSGRPLTLRLANDTTLPFDALIDASPDADLARQAGVPYIKGLGSLLAQGDRPGPHEASIGVSSVFRITGVDRHALMGFEARLRALPQMAYWLTQACPTRSPKERADLIDRPCYSPDEMDYVDILNPAIGVAYHVWRENGALSGSAHTYPDADIWIDGGNVSRLNDGSLGFNGMVTRIPDPQTLLDLSHGAPIPEKLLAEMRYFEAFLQTVGGLTNAKIIPPAQLYVRQTYTLQAQHNMTAAVMLSGGVPPEEAIGTYSYWLDLRGVTLAQYFNNAHLPKPVFNVGLKVAYPQAEALSNLAFVSRSAGYSPVGQGAGRIVQHNSMLGEGVGIAAVMALGREVTFSEISAQEVRAVLDQRCMVRTGKPVLINGQALMNTDDLSNHSLLQADQACVDFQEASTV